MSEQDGIQPVSADNALQLTEAPRVEEEKAKETGDSLEESRLKRWRIKFVFWVALVFSCAGLLAFYILVYVAALCRITHPALVVCVSVSGLIPASILGMLIYYVFPSKKGELPDTIPFSAVLNAIIDKFSNMRSSS